MSPHQGRRSLFDLPLSDLCLSVLGALNARALDAGFARGGLAPVWA
jgi:hypothetical protein